MKVYGIEVPDENGKPKLFEDIDGVPMIGTQEDIESWCEGNYVSVPPEAKPVQIVIMRAESLLLTPFAHRFTNSGEDKL